jgi:hypothetical protein
MFGGDQMVKPRITQFNQGTVTAYSHPHTALQMVAEVAIPEQQKVKDWHYGPTMNTVLLLKL